MCNIIHDSPLVVEGRPGTAASAHFENDAAERPDINGTEAAFVAAFDDFRGHVHGGAGHRFLFLGNFGKGGCGGGIVICGGGFGLLRLESLILAGYHFSRAKVNVFYYAIVVKEDVYGKSGQ